MKEEIIKEIMEYPIKYAVLYGYNKDGKWDEERLKFTELSDLKDKLRDIKTFERNKAYWDGQN